MESKPLRKRLPLRAAGLVLVLPLGLGAGCSPAMFWTNGKDPTIQNARSYRQVNPACSGINLSTAQVDAATALRVVDCFNTYGALKEAAQLMHAMDTADLQSILDVANRYALTNEKTLYGLQVTLEDLRKQGILDESLAQFGRLLENEEFVAASLSLLREGYQGDEASGGGQKDVLKALEILSTQVTSENVAKLLEFGLSVVSAPALVDLQAGLKWIAPAECEPGHPTHPTCALRQYTDALARYISEKSPAKKLEGGRLVLDRIVDGTLFAALDAMMGTTPESIRANVDRYGLMTHVMLEDRGAILDAMTSLFHYFNGELRCLKGTQRVPNGVKHVIRELVGKPTADAATYIQRDSRLILQSLTPFCEYPPELATYYPAMVSLADRTAVQPAVDLMKAFYQVQTTDALTGRTERPLLELLVGILADTGEDNRTGIKRLIPAMAALSERKIWDDLLLLATSVPVADRPQIQEALRFLLQPRAELSGKQSLYAVLTGAMSKTQPESLYRFVYSLRRFMNAEGKLIEPAFRALRSALYVNDASPLLGSLRLAMADATANEAAFGVVFKIAQMPEFAGAVRMVSEMARREDGRLKDLLTSTISLFRQFASKGQFPISSRQEPAFVSQRFHSWAAQDLVVFPDGPAHSEAPAACTNLDPRVSLANLSDPQFGKQFEATLACLNTDERFADVVGAAKFLERTQLETGKTAFGTLVDLAKELPLRAEQVGYMGEQLLAAIEDDRFSRILNASRLFVLAVPGSDGAVIRPLFDFLRPVVNHAWADWKRTSGLIADLIRKSQTFAAAGFGLDLWQAAVPANDTDPAPLDPAPHAPVMAIDRAYIGRFVESKECVSRPQFVPISTARREERVDEILYDFHHAVNDWELIDGHGRSSYDIATFQKRLTPVLDRIADPAASHPDRHVVDAMLNLIRYFDLKPGEKPTRTQHFERGYLLRWLHERSNDPRLITYFYEGESLPRTRLVSSLDMLDLVLTEAARSPLPIVDENFGLKFLKEIGEAWGDEDNTAWPEPIRRKFHGGKSSRYYPKTLRAAVGEMLQTLALFESIAGFPERPSCPRTTDVPPDYQIPSGTSGIAGWIDGSLTLKSSVHNIRQVMQVLLENLPGSGHPHAGGIKVLRNLFFEMYYSTPQPYRCLDDSALGAERVRCYVQSNLKHNNLSVILDLVKLGMTRNAGRILQGVDAKDPAVNDFVETLIDGAKSTQLKQIAIQLASPDRRGREFFWKVMTEVFATLDRAQGFEVPRIKQLIFYILAAPQMVARSLPPGPENSSAAVAERFLKVVAEVLDENREYFADHVGTLDALVKSRAASLIARALYESPDAEGKQAVASVFSDLIRNPAGAVSAMRMLRAADRDAGSQKAWNMFWSRWDAVRATPEYRAMDLGAVGRDMLRFMAGDASRELGRETAASLRAYFAAKLQSVDADALVRLAASQPDAVFGVFETLGRYSRSGGEIDEFTRLARRALSEVH